MRQGIGDRKRRHDAIVSRDPDTSRVRRAALLAALALIAGCGNNKSEKLPAACSGGPLVITQALRKAPGVVTLQGTPISRCFTRNAQGTDIEIVGTDMVVAAEQLHDAAQQGKPGAALQLGYLVGAAQRGAKRSGLGNELVRRIEAETSGLGSGRAAYQRGVQAGLARG